MPPHPTPLHWPSQRALLHRSDVLPLVDLAGSLAALIAADGSVARPKGDPLRSAWIAPGTDDAEHRSGHERPSSRTDDWGIGYG